ncbi:hypothetical protein [Streptomyces roseus]|uniref:Uncharacterized protein n=1 Tax=Streptomyces roseus TaxID=66430 RepID=A0A0J6XYU3_9ACTN|nr:hypothetical protein [Streptomyces roseus]KMO99437.1 hypothetical protein ACS04_01930 [Streptomyces roseus]
MRDDRKQFYIDFGLSGLTRIVDAGWAPGTTLLEIVAAAADWGGGAYAPTLLEDALRVLESGLSPREVDILWCAASKRSYRPEFFGIDGRAWLRQVVDVSVERIRQDDPSFRVAPAGTAPAASFAADVLAEVASVADALRSVEGHPHYRVPDVVLTLEKTVMDVDPDLGFRMLLRVLKAYQITIGEARLARYRDLGERLGYDECVVEDGGIDVGPDPAD